MGRTAVLGAVCLRHSGWDRVDRNQCGAEHFIPYVVSEWLNLRCLTKGR